MAYAAEEAEIALRNLLDTQTGAQLATYLREFLRTRQLTPDLPTVGDPVSSARTIASQLLRYKRVPQLAEPSEIEVAEAVQAYLDAPTPTAEQLETRYQKLMTRAKHPNKLSDLRYDGPSDAVGYRRLADGLTRMLKQQGDAPYTPDEIDAIALVCEHYTNLRRHKNPWAPVTASQHEPLASLVYRWPNESNISFAERSYYEAVNRISRIYTGSILRDTATGERTSRVKSIYHPESYLFQLAPALPMSMDYEGLASTMFAAPKMHIADASTRISKLADALKAYHHAFQELLSQQQATLEASLDRPAYASFVATNSLRRELVSMKSLLIRAGFSHEAASSALFTFAVRLGVSRDLSEELDAALDKAAQTHNEHIPALDEHMRHEWLAEVSELRPYVSSRALFHPAQGIETGATVPGNTISSSTIEHLATVGLAAPNLGYHMD